MLDYIPGLKQVRKALGRKIEQILAPGLDDLKKAVEPCKSEFNYFIAQADGELKQPAPGWGYKEAALFRKRDLPANLAKELK